MKFLIIGLGSLGSKLARNLVENGFEVHGIDLNPSRLEKNNLLQRTFQLDACIRDELIHLQLQHYDKILVCFGSKYERCNLITSLILPELTKSEIIVQYLSEIQRKSLEAVGITKFIDLHEINISKLMEFE